MLLLNKSKNLVVKNDRNSDKNNSPVSQNNKIKVNVYIILIQ